MGSAGSGGGRGLPASRSFVAAVVFVVALALGAVWLVAGRGRGAEPAPAPGAVASAPAQAPSGPAASGGGSAAGSVCGMDAGPQTPPSGAPAFELLRVSSVLSVPVVDGAGPGITDGITRCFAHSPTGAVVAAVNFMRWLSSRERLPEVVDVLMEPSGDRDRMAQQVQSGWDGSKARAVTIRGYRTQVRGADEVLVTVLTSIGMDDGRLMSWQLVMVWSGGDWKVRAPSNDSWGEQVEESTAGFSAWTVK